MDLCPVCQSTSNFKQIGLSETYEMTCPQCGVHKFTGTAIAILVQQNLSKRQEANISGWLYHNQPFEISSENIDWLKALKAPRFHERADMLLLAIEGKTNYAGERLKTEPYWLSASWSIKGPEFNEIIEYLHNVQQIDCDGAGCKITHKGWARLAELQKINADSEQCFVAMWFDQKMNKIYDDVIAKAVLDAGYRPHRVDKKEFNDRIDDEIIAQIRRSRFIVADFTGHRGGVYYEAGFAKGLGLEVFWTCRKDGEKDLHFDIRQYNCIFWEEDKLPDFKKSLANRIESVLGRGNYRA
jgi:hypothetical protein